jgi:hypothetical protein
MVGIKAILGPAIGPIRGLVSGRVININSIDPGLLADPLGRILKAADSLSEGL